MKPRVVLARRLPENAAREASRRFDIINCGAGDLTTNAALALVREHRAWGMVIANNVHLDAAAISALPKTFRIAASATAGHDHIDLLAATAKGIIVTNTPGVLDTSTAEYTVMLMLMASRRVGAHLALVAHGWERPLLMNEMLGVSLSGKSLGIVGMGRIGRAVADLARAFGLQVHYHNRTRLGADLEGEATYHDSLDSLLESVDIVSLHCGALSDGRALLTHEHFLRMHRGGILVNTARGSLVDESALVDALNSGHIAAAGLDVFSVEPDPPADLVAHPSIVATPHMASGTVEARESMALRALDNLSACFAGDCPPDSLNSEVAGLNRRAGFSSHTI